MNDFFSMRRLLYGSAVLLMIISLVFIRSYTKEKRSNLALRLQVMTLNKQKRTAAPWHRILPPPQEKTSTDKIRDTVSTQSSSTVTSDRPLEERTTADLAMFIEGQMPNVKRLSRTQLDKIIETADEVILRSPDIYSAYKAKLIALLVEESKFNQPIEDDEINNLLESMAGFNISADTTLKREATLLSNANLEIDGLELNLAAIEEERQFLLSDPNLSESDKQTRLASLQTREQELNTRAAQLQDNLEIGLAQNATYPGEDIVQIPFMRMMANEDYDGVLDSAESFIEQFPSSPLGHFYQIRALELMGRSDDALTAISNSRLAPDTQNQLLQMLNDAKNEDPKRYWEKLKF